MIKSWWFRLALHIPLGLFNVFAYLLHFGLGMTFTIGFLVYEIAQDINKRDQSQKDIIGWLCGVVLGTLALGAYVLWHHPQLIRITF